MARVLSRAVASDGVVNIFAVAGLANPDMSIFSEQFLADVKGMPQRNLAVELLRKLLSGESGRRAAKGDSDGAGASGGAVGSVGGVRPRSLRHCTAVSLAGCPHSQHPNRSPRVPV